MPKLRSHSTPRVSRFAVAAWLAMMVALRPMAAQAAPETAGAVSAGTAALAVPAPAPAPAVPATPAAGVATDPITRFLSERGLLNAWTAAAPGGPPGAAESGENAFVGRLRDTASDMVLTAMNFIGVPYRRGGNSAERGFDCSGFTRHVFELSLGLVLPHRADEQATTAGLTSIGRDQLKPGDLVFFNTLRRTFSHVGIYVGGGKFIHSPKPGGEVRVDDMAASYWSHRFTGARRADVGLDATPVQPAVAPTAPVAKPPSASARNVY